MAFSCYYCEKARQKAHKVSHSNRKARKWQQPNLQAIHVLIGGRSVRIRVCTRCIRTGGFVKAA